jgi:cellulose synthase (UDP-forming)
LVGIAFDLVPSIERDLLIRKLFTSGKVTEPVTASAWSATLAVLQSIWTAPTAEPEVMAGDQAIGDEANRPAKLPPESLVVLPHAEQHDWADLVEQRRAVA